MNRIIFNQIVKENQPKKNVFKHCLLAFLGGGLMGILSQGLIDLYIMWGLDKSHASSLSSLTIVSIASLLTILSVYKNIGQIFGAGLFLPISGFSNSMVSASLEGKSEGLVPGIGSSIFKLAGSVISYGIFFSVFVVLVRYLLSYLGVNL